jgi:hypothetical protein
MATTDPLPTGQYTTLISLLDSSDFSIQTLPIETNSIVDGQSTDIGVFFFTFGSACDASTCNGCCEGNTCVNEQSEVQCGTSGVPCDNCASIGLFCDMVNGICTN